MGRGHIVTEALTTVVRIETDAGIDGVGESCPIGGSYLVAHPRGIIPALDIMAPALIGLDPRETHVIERAMDRVLRGHQFAKSAVDIACWDILGKSTGLPVHTLLGGKMNVSMPMYRVIPQKTPEETRTTMDEYRAEGYRQFQVKVGNNWKQDIENILLVHDLLQPGEVAYADANMGWTVQEAMQIVHAVKHTGIMLEQPCATYEECLHVRNRSPLPTKLDECITDIKMVQKAIQDQSAEVLCLKLSNQGGLTKARRARDLAVENGLSVVAEDTWGGEITTAALSHFAASTPADYLFNTTDLHNYNHGSTGTPAPETKDGRLLVTDAPGLGVELDRSSVGEAVAIFQ